VKDPLTRDALIAIQDRNPDSADVRALLWEISRLRSVVLRSHDFFRQPATSSTASIMAENLRRLLDEEPVVKEQPRLE
jgi:hypothetical protein